MPHDFSASSPPGDEVVSVPEPDPDASPFVPLSEIVARDFGPLQTVACPDCGAKLKPHSGFGPAPEWRHVGKYECCNGVFYMNPYTGVEYVRTRRHLIANRRDPR